jgi:cell division septation protein DedD/TolB-like protein
MTAKKYSYKLLPLLLAFFFVACTHSPPKVVDIPSFKKWASTGDTQKVIAVLPFTNETKTEDLNRLVREGFYEYFSVRLFHDIEIYDTDSTIELLTQPGARDLSTIPPEELGRALNCDALVYGKVKSFKRIFLLIYSQTIIETEIRIVETKTGKELWKHSLTRRFHEGGVPTGPFAVIPAVIRTTYGLRNSKRNRDIDAFCKKFVSLIPKIQHLHPNEIKKRFDLQVASFKMKDGALTISSELNQHGYKTFLKEVYLDDEIWHRVMTGPFTSKKEALGYQAKLKGTFSYLDPIVVSNEDSNNTVITKAVRDPCKVQVAAFKLEEGASTIYSKLFQRGYKPFLTKAHNNGETWYKVMVGPFPSKKEAVQYQANLKKDFHFLNPIVLRTKNNTESGVKNTVE